MKKQIVMLSMSFLMGTICFAESNIENLNDSSNEVRITNVMGVSVVVTSPNSSFPLDPKERDFELLCKDRGYQSYLDHAVTYSRDLRRDQDANYYVYCNTGKDATVSSRKVTEVDGTAEISWPLINGEVISKSSNEDMVCKLFGYKKSLSVELSRSQIPATLKINRFGKISVKQPGVFMLTEAFVKYIFTQREPEINQGISAIKCQ